MFLTLLAPQGAAPPAVVAPARRPKRHRDKRPFVLQMPGGAGTVATADDRDLLEIVNILASTGVFHGQDRIWQ